jgi:hypothetical protein
VSVIRPQGCIPTMLTLSSPQTEDRYKTLSKRMGTMVQLIVDRSAHQYRGRHDGPASVPGRPRGH